MTRICSSCEAKLGLNTKDFKREIIYGYKYRYYTVCPECGAKVNIGEDLIPHNLKLTLIHKFEK